MANSICVRSKAWLAASVWLRLARLPRPASRVRRSRRLRDTLAAVPDLLAHACVTETVNFVSDGVKPEVHSGSLQLAVNSLCFALGLLCSCECHLDSAQQIQLLRLLHALIDRDTDDSYDRWIARARLLSEAEAAAMRSLDNLSNFVSPASTLRALAEVQALGEGGGLDKLMKGRGGKPSLLRVLLNLLMTSSTRSPYRFWLSSCVETFLR